MAEHRYDTNWDDGGRYGGQQQISSDAVPAIIVLLALGVGIAAVLALLFAPKPKPKRSGIMGELEERFNTLEKELGHLNKRIQERLKELA